MQRGGRWVLRPVEDRLWNTAQGGALDLTRGKCTKGRTAGP